MVSPLFEQSRAPVQDILKISGCALLEHSKLRSRARQFEFFICSQQISHFPPIENAIYSFTMFPIRGNHKLDQLQSRSYVS